MLKTARASVTAALKRSLDQRGGRGKRNWRTTQSVVRQCSGSGTQQIRLAPRSARTSLVKVSCPARRAARVGSRNGVAVGGYLDRGQTVPDTACRGIEVPQIALVGSIPKARGGPLSAAFWRPQRRADTLGAELDRLSVLCILAAVIHGARVIADPRSLIGQPPVALIQVILSTEIVLCSTEGAGSKTSP
jgi:hypothetical protein